MLALLISAQAHVAHAGLRGNQYFDTRFNYAFQLPPNWVLLKEVKDDLIERVSFKSPSGSVLKVIITETDRLEPPVEPSAGKKLMESTIDKMYRKFLIAKGAKAINILKKQVIPEERAFQCFIEVLGILEQDFRIVLSGIHTAPYGVEYAINFMLLTTPEIAQKEKDWLKELFNSFQILPQP
jgi:hypothetical protein